MNQNEHFSITESRRTRHGPRLLTGGESYARLALAGAFAISPIVLEYLIGVVVMRIGTVESQVRIFRLLIAYPIVCGLVLLVSMKLSRKPLAWHNLTFAMIAVFIGALNVVGLWLNLELQRTIDAM